jgi:hypothetical protein
MIPGLEDRLLEGSEEAVMQIADLVSHWPLFQKKIQVIYMFRKIQKGASGARSDDTKSLKSSVLDWIVPRGQSLQPPLSRNVKVDRGFHHERTGSLICPAGLDWSDIE